MPVNSGFERLDDLAGKRIATSFEVMAGKLFKEVDARVGADGAKPTEVEYVGGSVEAACALGVADGIVDLVGASPSHLLWRDLVERVLLRPAKQVADPSRALPCASPPSPQSPATRCAPRACTRSTRS